jgi:hypothetical protein
VGESADAQNLLGLTIKCYAKQIHQRCVEVATLRIMAFVVDDCLETDVISARGDMDAIDGYEVLREPSDEVHVIICNNATSSTILHCCRSRALIMTS